MRSSTLYDIIGIGTRFWHLVQGAPRDTNGDAARNVRAFVAELEEAKLPVSRRAADELLAFADDLAERESAAVLTNEDRSRLKELAQLVNWTLKAESRGVIVWEVTEKRLDVTKLLHRVPALLRTGAFDKLSPVAQNDLVEAGKCIAFDRPTAAAFHILRATEGTLRDFYMSIVKRRRLTTLLWGPMVESLRKRHSPPSKELLENLDIIRRNFRNPTQHPEKVYDIEEAQDLFGLCVDVINRMQTAKAP